MGLLDVLRLDPTALKHAGGEGRSTDPALAAAAIGTARRAGFDPSAGDGAVRGGADLEVITRELTPWKTKYGDLKLSATVKIQAVGKAGKGDPASVSGAVTSKDKPDGRKTGIKKTIAYTDFADRELFAGWSVEDFALGFESELSGFDVSVSGTFRFKVVTSWFKAPAQAKLTVLHIKEGDELTGPGIEFKIAPVSFDYKAGPAEAKVFVEYKASFMLDKNKVAKEVGKEILEKVAKEALEKEAKKQGVKVLGRKAAETVLKRLGPLAAAFGVGWDIGSLLNKYTAAPVVAKMVMDDVLGDLNERYHRADTLGKMWLITKNSPRIVAALIAAGVTGVVAGVGDLVLFKLFGLDKLKDFGPALEALGQGLTDIKQLASVPAETLGGAMLHGALAMGIKFNPKHAIVAHATLEPVVAAIFARIHPLYKTRGGLDKLLGVSVKDASLDPANFLKFATFAHGFKMNWDGKVDLTSPATVAASLKAMHVGAFLRFLEANKMIRCNVSLGDSLDADDIDPKLLDELHGG